MKAVDAFCGPSVRFAHRVFVEPRSPPAMKTSKKKAPFGAFSRIGVARWFRVTPFRSTPLGPSFRPSQKRYPFALLTAFLSNHVLSSGYGSVKGKGSIRRLFENRGSQMVPRHVVPLHPFGAVLSSVSKTLSVRFAHRVFVEPRSPPAMEASKKKAPFGAFLKIGVARFELTTFCSQSRRSTRLSYTP